TELAAGLASAGARSAGVRQRVTRVQSSPFDRWYGPCAHGMEHMGSPLLRAACAAALLIALSGPQGVAAQSASTCTEFIGFSQTEQFYVTGFIHGVSNPGSWQLRWFSGGSVDLWADRGYGGWGGSALVSHCAQNSGSP